MSDVSINAVKNGPLVVKGQIEITNSDGQKVQTEGPSAALCRCGHSAAKPMCDGSHRKANFQG